MPSPSAGIDRRRIAAMAGELTTDDLLDTWAFFRDEFEAGAQEILATELTRRGVAVGERELETYRERRRGEVLKTRDARLARCRYCSRLAPNGLTVRFYLLLLVPIWSTTIHFCDAHEDEVSRLTARLARWLSNLLWGIRYARVRAGTIDVGGPDMAPHTPPILGAPRETRGAPRLPGSV